MSTVSTFELLITRIAPPVPGPVGAVARRVIQGYFLTIGNLENRAINLSLRLVLASNSGNRIISSANTQMLVDVGAAGGSVPLPFSVQPNNPTAGASVVVTNRFTIAARHTGLVAVLPSLSQLGAADLEIRGVAELVQVRRFPFLGAPASRVLLTPDIRGTYLDNEFPATVPTPTNAELDFDQINNCLPLASGSAENTLAAIPPIFIDPGLTVGGVTFESLRQRNLDVAEEELKAVVDMFAEMK